MGQMRTYLETPGHGGKDTRLVAAKPCPFCGSHSQSLSRMGNYVHCNDCGADGPEIQRGSDDLWRIAIERWNLRYTDGEVKP